MAIVLRLAWRNIWRHKRRTWLTVSAIAFATALLIFSITLQLGSYDMMIDNSLRLFTGQLQIQRVGYHDKPQIREDIRDAVTVVGDLRLEYKELAFALRARGFALVSSVERSYGAQIIGVEPGYETAVSTIPKVIRKGRYLDDPQAMETVIGAALARNLKIEPGDELTLLGSGKDGSVAAAVISVVGVFESGMPELDRHLVEMPLRSFQDVFSMGDGAHMIIVAGAPLEQVSSIRDRLSERLRRRAELAVLTWDELLPGIKQTIQFDMIQNWVLYISLILMVTFSILNTFVMAVLERTHEFGIMLALGVRAARIGGLLMLESLLVTLIGLAIGILLGLGVAVYFDINGFTYPGLEEYGAQFGLPGVIYPKLSALTVLLGPAAIFVFTLLAALYPAFRIRRLRPVEALRATY